MEDVYLTTLRDLSSEINVDSVFRAEVSVVSQGCAHAAASAKTGLIAALLLVDVWADVTMTWSKCTPHKHLALGCIVDWGVKKKKEKLKWL